MSYVGLSRGFARLVVFSFFLACTIFPLTPSFGENFDVPSDRARSISDAIRLANANDNVTTTADVIEVAADTYVENLEVSSSMTIRAKNGAKVVLRAASSEAAIRIVGASSSVTIGGLILITPGTGVLIDGAGGSPSVILRNLVITRASTAIQCNGTISSTTIAQVTFFGVGNGINCPTSPSITIRNNIFSDLSNTPITSFVGGTGFTPPVQNLFWNVPPPPNTGERGSEVTVTLPQTLDPEFVDTSNVDPEENDFHLKSGSAGIGAGEGGFDVGAYGGPSAFTVPFPAENLTVACGVPDPQSCSVSWEQNLDHLVTGYLVLTSAPSAPNPSYERTDPVENAASQCTGSPSVCSFTRRSLVDTGTTPAQPSTPTAGFGDTRVQLTWPPVTGATTYDVYFGTSSPPTTVARTVSEPTAQVTNLTNGVLYYFAVGAVNQPKFHAAVQAVYGSPVSASNPASDISEATPVVYGTAQPGPLSAEVTSTPQPLVDFPPLENNGGCFIATAAFGSSLAPQVDVLRAFRERYLRPYPPGRELIRIYETWSPPFAEVIRSSDTARLVVRSLLWPVVGAAWIAVHGPWWALLMGAVATAAWIVLMRRRGAARA